MSCEFEQDDYICGYQVTPPGQIFHWERKTVDRSNVKGEPKTDGQGSEIGKNMLK